MESINIHTSVLCECHSWAYYIPRCRTSYDACFPTAFGVEAKCFRGEGGVQTDFHCGASQWSFGSTEDIFHWSTVLSVDGSLVGKSWWLAIRLPQVILPFIQGIPWKSMTMNHQLTRTIESTPIVWVKLQVCSPGASGKTLLEGALNGKARQPPVAGRIFDLFSFGQCRWKLRIAPGA